MRQHRNHGSGSMRASTWPVNINRELLHRPGARPLWTPSSVGRKEKPTAWAFPSVRWTEATKGAEPTNHGDPPIYPSLATSGLYGSPLTDSCCRTQERLDDQEKTETQP